ncbi:MAG: helix-turn-helix domain-containing protein [Dysgonomonas sp.]
MNKKEIWKSKQTTRLDLKTLGYLNNFILLKNPNAEYRINEPYVFEEITFALCTKGYASIKINMEEYAIEEESILIIPSDHLIELVSRSNDLELKTLFFSFDFISDLNLHNRYEIIEKNRRVPCLKVSPKDMSILIEFHSLILHLYDSDDDTILRENMIKGVLSGYLTKISSLYLSIDLNQYKAPVYKNNVMKQFIDLIGIYHKEDRTVNFYADKMNMTARGLSQNVYRTTGRMALVWINDFVITKIKVLLRTTNLTATQISDEYNFPTPSLFGRFFKKHTGMTPNDFRHS